MIVKRARLRLPLSRVAASAGAAALLLGAALSAGAALARDIPAIPDGMAYATARGVLIGRGFRPVVSGERDMSRCSAGRQDVCAAYPETIACAGTGNAACRFIFSGPNQVSLTLVAEGANVGRLRVTATRRSAASDVEWQRRR